MDRASDFRSKLVRLRHRSPFRFPADAVPGHFRRSAVLIAFWPDGEGIAVALTRRAAHLADHAGQVAFPGGRLEPGESFIAAALREAREEIGLQSEQVEVLGALDDAWSGAGHHIVPVVGWLAAPPALCPEPGEVAEILLADVDEITRPEARGIDLVEYKGVRYANTTLLWRGAKAYGLTADLLLEAIEWGRGGAPANGAARLAQLRTFLAP